MTIPPLDGVDVSDLFDVPRRLNALAGAVSETLSMMSRLVDLLDVMLGRVDLLTEAIENHEDLHIAMLPRPSRDDR